MEDTIEYCPGGCGQPADACICDQADEFIDTINQSDFSKKEETTINDLKV